MSEDPTRYPQHDTAPGTTGASSWAPAATQSSADAWGGTGAAHGSTAQDAGQGWGSGYAQPTAPSDTYPTGAYPTGAYPAAGTGQPADAHGDGATPWWQQPAATAPAPKPKRPLGLIAGVALLAALLGGGAGAATAALVADSDGSSTSATRTVVESGSGSTAAAPVTGTTSAVAAKVLPGVVQIQEESSDGSGGTGSGIILRTSGYILTNNHVVAEAASGGKLQVTLNDGRKAAATIVGRDVGADLAVVKVDGVTGLTPVALGSSSGLQVGQQVVAVGSPLGLAGTVTEGIVSALNRPVSTSEAGTTTSSSDTSVLNAIQTDTAINPGNSGGALVDMSGRLVGINSAIASLGSTSGTQSGSIGLGFAIPVDQAKRIANLLITTGSSTRALLGASFGEAPDGGALVRSVTPGGAADAGGLRNGDIVTKIGKQLVDESTALVAAVRSSDPGSTVTITYTRGGRTATATVTLGTVKS